MHIYSDNVNEAYAKCSTALVQHGQRESSRNGEVYRIYEPVTITYNRPDRRVLFGKGRNPFFHVYESIWILAGRSDVEKLTPFVSNFKQYADRGGDVWDAYGKRLRRWFNHDQMFGAAEQLKRNPGTRRCVMAIWDGSADFRREVSYPENPAVPCNLAIVLQMRGDALDMTVFNRSNDMVWGALGANVVHFSIIHEVMARAVQATLGRYHQVTTNLHAYTKTWDQTSGWSAMQYPQPTPILFNNLRDFLDVCEEFAEEPHENTGNTFLDNTAYPMMLAHQAYKTGDLDGAIHCVKKHVQGPDWREACLEWLQARK